MQITNDSCVTNMSIYWYNKFSINSQILLNLPHMLKHNFQYVVVVPPNTYFILVIWLHTNASPSTFRYALLLHVFTTGIDAS